MARPLQHPHADDIGLDGVLHALADPIRRSIVGKLIDRGEMNCGETCGDMAPSTISHHHRILRESGLIRSEKRGVAVVNSVRQVEIEARFPGLLGAILQQHRT
ncbi:MAG: Transcriptional regulator, ArsR family [Sphingomonas bacterium]|jgi:DNA-binding transcriptional ArsR family regulator|nr:ArsR family transcriptional regulator [Sphingomonas bacterium]MDB5689427.1 Transcriptional regulator, ArsR family [Sphingomonas bacterium]